MFDDFYEISWKKCDKARQATDDTIIRHIRYGMLDN